MKTEIFECNGCNGEFEVKEETIVCPNCGRYTTGKVEKTIVNQDIKLGVMIHLGHWSKPKVVCSGSDGTFGVFVVGCFTFYNKAYFHNMPFVSWK